MPRYTSAYSGFNRRLGEVETLLRMARDSALLLPSPNNLARTNALCRSGVVLLSSHIEAYIEDLSEIALSHIVHLKVPKSMFSPRFRYYLSKDLILDIKNTNDPDSIADKIDRLLQRDNHIWGQISHFSQDLSPDIFHGDFSNPTHIKIRKLFARFGYSQFQYDLERFLAADFTPLSNMVNQVVDQRNKIAHGDFATAGSPSDLNDMIRLSKSYCRAVDKVVADWFKQQGCPIR
ncbi:MAG: hypothetical protein KF770_15255 [Anaerolineae bacterium]|nr:hypothetical protein [Anaerolineae bacterium]